MDALVVGDLKPKLSQCQRAELVRGVREQRYTTAQAARLFGVHPATVNRLIAQVRVTAST